MRLYRDAGQQNIKKKHKRKKVNLVGPYYSNDLYEIFPCIGHAEVLEVTVVLRNIPTHFTSLHEEKR